MSELKAVTEYTAWHVGFDDYIYHGGWKSMFIYLDFKQIKLKKTWSNRSLLKNKTYLRK